MSAKSKAKSFFNIVIHSLWAHNVTANACGIHYKHIFLTNMCKIQLDSTCNFIIMKAGYLFKKTMV